MASKSKSTEKELNVNLNDGGVLEIPDPTPAEYPSKAPAGETLGPDFLSGTAASQQGYTSEGIGAPPKKVPELTKPKQSADFVTNADYLPKKGN